MHGVQYHKSLQLHYQHHQKQEKPLKHLADLENSYYNKALGTSPVVTLGFHIFHFLEDA